MRLLITGVLFALLLGISITDLRTRRIPNRYNAALFILGVGSGFLWHSLPAWERMLGALCVSAPLFLIACLFPGAIGGGDIKLIAASGVLLGVQGNLRAACFGMGLAGVYALFLLGSGRACRRDFFALGPFLCAGIAAAWLGGFGAFP